MRNLRPTPRKKIAIASSWTAKKYDCLVVRTYSTIPGLVHYVLTYNRSSLRPKERGTPRNFETPSIIKRKEMHSHTYPVHTYDPSPLLSVRKKQAKQESSGPPRNFETSSIPKRNEKHAYIDLPLSVVRSAHTIPGTYNTYEPSPLRPKERNKQRSSRGPRRFETSIHHHGRYTQTINQSPGTPKETKQTKPKQDRPEFAYNMIRNFHIVHVRPRHRSHDHLQRAGNPPRVTIDRRGELSIITTYRLCADP